MLSFNLMALAIIILIAYYLYFLPTIIAMEREHRWQGVIFAVNLVLGLTVIGYVAALVWACWPKRTDSSDTESRAQTA